MCFNQCVSYVSIYSKQAKYGQYGQQSKYSQHGQTRCSWKASCHQNQLRILPVGPGDNIQMDWATRSYSNYKLLSSLLDALASLWSMLESHSVSHSVMCFKLALVTWAYLWHILGIAWTYLVYIFGIIWAYHGQFFLCLVWEQILDILGIYVACLRHWLGTFWALLVVKIGCQ